MTKREIKTDKERYGHMPQNHIKLSKISQTPHHSTVQPPPIRRGTLRHSRVLSLVRAFDPQALRSLMYLLGVVFTSHF